MAEMKFQICVNCNTDTITDPCWNCGYPARIKQEIPTKNSHYEIDIESKKVLIFGEGHRANGEQVSSELLAFSKIRSIALTGGSETVSVPEGSGFAIAESHLFKINHEDGIIYLKDEAPLLAALFGKADQDKLRSAATIGKMLEKEDTKVRDFALRLSGLSDLLWNDFTLTKDIHPPEERYRRWDPDVKGLPNTWRVIGIIRVRDKLFDAIEILGNPYDMWNHYSVAYSITGIKIDNSWANLQRNKEGRKKMVWHGGQLAKEWNKELKTLEPAGKGLPDGTTFRNELQSLEREFCSRTFVVYDKTTSDTLILFGDQFPPRRWGALPDSLLPTTGRLQLADALAEKIRAFSGVKKKLG